MHHFASYSSLMVRVRYTDTRDALEQNDHLVKDFKLHPEFRQGGRFANNIATLVLDKPINLVEEKGVNAACLPGCNDMFDHTFKNHTGTSLIFLTLFSQAISFLSMHLFVHHKSSLSKMTTLDF